MSTTHFYLVRQSWRSYDTCDKLLESYCELNAYDEYKLNSLKATQVFMLVTNAACSLQTFSRAKKE